MRITLDMIYLHKLIQQIQMNNDKQRFASNTTFDEATQQSIIQLLKHAHFNGQLIIEKNDTYFEWVQGFENLSAKTLIGEDAIYYAGSISKFVTGIIIEQLIDEKELSYSDSVSKYIPLFNYPEVTIEDLLLHRSGLETYETKNNIHGIDEAILNICTITRNNKPKYVYNDANYVLLAKIIEILTKQSYQSVVTERLIIPLELKQTFFENQKINLTGSYKKGIWLLEDRKDDLDQYIGAGHLKMSLKNIQKLSKAFVNGDIFNDEKMNHILRPLPYKSQKYRNGISVRDGYLRIRGCIHGFDVINYFNKDMNIIIGTNMSNANDGGKLEDLLMSIFELIQ